MVINDVQEMLVIDGEPTLVPDGAVAWKQTDALEDACWLYDEREARSIDHDDPGVVLWVTTDRSHLN